MVKHEEIGKRYCQTHGDYMALSIHRVETGCPACVSERMASEQLQSAQDFTAEHLQNRKTAALTEANIPPRFQDRTFDNYAVQNREQQRALAVCKRYVEAFDDCHEKGRCLVLVGKSGTGKTHLSCAMASALAQQGRSVRFVEVYALIDEIKHEAFHGEGSEHGEIKRYSEDYDLLILDEVGAQLGSDWERSTLFKIINNRYKACLPTIMISNVERSDFIAYVGDRVYDRLQENGGITVLFQWDSHRRASK